MISLKQFIHKYDKANSIILLEGKRDVLPQDRDKLIALGKLLASKTTKMIFRSGNADGADYYFSLGVSEIDKKRLQVITPYSGHRQKTNNAYETISLDDISLAAEPEVVYQTKQNKKNEKLVEQYVSGKRDQYSIKAAYLIRDTIKAIGTSTVPAASFGIFYDDLDNPKAGGTGHTMKVCENNGIPVVDQSVWFGWLNE